MKYILIILLIITPVTTQAALFSTEEWVSMYLSPCPKTPDNRVCYAKTKRNLKRMLSNKKLLLKYLTKYNLKKWLGIICVVESECYEKAISKDKKTGRILAVGFMQIAPSNLIYYLTTNWNGIDYHYKRISKTPKVSGIHY